MSDAPPPRFSRRALLRRGATGLAFGLAGCLWPGDVPDIGDGRGPSRSPVPPLETPVDPVDGVYVAPDGRTDAAGTRADPLGDLTDALGVVRPGQTIVLRGGTYRPARTVGARGLAGEAEAPIRIVPAVGERPIFDFAGDRVGGLRFSTCAWIELVGIEIRNAPSRGVFVEEGSTRITIQDVTVRDSGGDADASGADVFVLDSTDVTIRNVVATGSFDPSTGGRNADGIAVENSPGTLVESCVAANNSDDGFDLWATTGVTLRDCVAYGNGWRPDGRPGGDGNGFKLGGGDDSGHNRIEFCVAYGNRVRGFDDNGATRPLVVYNCTAWDNPVNFRLGCRLEMTDLPICPAHVLRNNLSHEGVDVFSPLVDSAANSWDLDLRDPKFVSTDPDDPDFLALTPGSPAIDAGTDLGIPYSGSAPDLGAVEFE